MPIGQKEKSEGYYTHLPSKYSKEKRAYIPQGLLWKGPKEKDTLERRAQELETLRATNPMLKKLRFRDPAFDEKTP